MFDFKIKVQSSKTVYTPEIKLCTLTMDGNAMLGQILKRYFRKLHNYIQNLKHCLSNFAKARGQIK